MFNLFLIIAAKFLGAMRLGKQCRRIELQRLFDYPKDPVTIYRMILLLAAAAMTLCCAVALAPSISGGWNPDDPTTTARVTMAKRWFDPIAICLSMLWIGWRSWGSLAVSIS